MNRSVPAEMTKRVFSPRRILVVDDETEIRHLLREILEGEGHFVVEAADGKEAVRAAAQRDFDLAIIDLVMPEQEGIETIQMLRRSRPGLRIVAISGAFGGAFLKAAGHLGALATVKKPFSVDGILSSVEKVLEMEVG